MKSSQFLEEGFVEDAHEVHQDHEVQMARADCFHAAEDALVLHKMLRSVGESQGLEGWVAAKITLASDYLKTVREHLEYQLMSGGMDQADGTSPIDRLISPAAMPVNGLPVAEGATLKKVKREYNQAAKDAGGDWAGCGKKIDTMKKSLRQKDVDKKKGVAEEWSQKYKNSINCSHPKGFSQKAHCAGKKKHNESMMTMEAVCPDCGMCETHGNNMMEVKQRLDAKCWSGKHKEGTKIKGGIRVNNCVPNESVNEMDKSQTPPGRDGSGSNDPDAGKKQYTAKATTPKKVTKMGANILNKSFKDAHTKKGVKEMSAGSVATVVNPTPKNKAKVGSLFGGTYKQSAKAK